MAAKITPIFFFFSLQFLTILLHVNSQDQSILLRLRQEWQSQPPLNQWTPSNTSSSYCTWPGVTCSNNSVTALNFNSINISGTVPPFICDLNNLQTLDLGNNSFIGMFPNLYNCSKLQYLDLSQNYFVGLLPSDIDRFSHLTFLNLNGNNFTGDIPPAIGRLENLTNLWLHQNQFNGTFPSEIGNLINLEYLYMAYNRRLLPSSLPSNFTRMTKLKELWFSQSNLIGEIPEMIGEMTALQYLDLSENGLTGNIPLSLFTLKNLSILYLQKNQLSGEIPELVESLNLIELDLSDNNLTGKVPDGFGNLEKLTVLNLFYNQLSGEIPPSIGRLPALKVFKLFSNNFSGVIPPEMGRHSSLEEFDVASNRLTGRLPEYICNRGMLVGAVAFDNNLTGELPESLGNCSSLQQLSISQNSFSGEIPDGMWTGLHLTSVTVSENFFTGELPHEVSSNLSRFEISNNRFSGKIPTGASWRNVVVFNASNNLFSGPIPQELTAYPRLTTLLLDRNQLNGSLPSDIISWKSLNTLNLSRNELSGEIPEEIASLPALNELDLSDNRFSGEIPPQLGSLRPTFLNLSSNHLTGNIPVEFENLAYNESFLNNPGLCTTSSYLSLNLCNSRPETANKNSTKSVVAIIVSVLAAALALALLLSFLVIRVYQKKKHSLNTTWKFNSFQKLSFTESDILSRLTENNRIGSGGSGKVYRVSINPSGIPVAVKKIWNDRKLDQKLEKEFRAEVEILSSIRHVNIVKLLCCISNDDSKLLVYEYLERRSLDQWLHKRKSSANVSGPACQPNLEWPVRFRIAVGAAHGLSYLHHDCSPPIVHRDVKSSNILLDSDFNAKIADFGLARMLLKQGEAIVSSVAGSFGYMAPEYAQTAKVDEKIDVYSYGVVLLELTTGKEANYGDENTSLADWAWRHINQGKPVSDVLDEKIKESSYLEEMSIVFKLGVKCTSKLPSARPSMRQVLQILIQCSHPLVYGAKGTEKEYDATPFLLNSKRADSMGSDDNV